MRRSVVFAAVVALFTVAVAPVAVGAPGNSNGVMEVSIFDDPFELDCDGDGATDVWGVEEGFVKFKEFQGEGNKNLEITIFHLNIAYTNAEGDTWVWRDRGPDHLYVDGNGDLILTVTGRSGANNIGHVVANLSTGELVRQAGQAPFGGEFFEKFSDDYACEVLVD